MMISSPGRVVVRLNVSSISCEFPKQSINLNLVLKNGVLVFLRNPASRTANLRKVVHICNSKNLMKNVTDFNSKNDRGSDGDGNGNLPPGNGGSGGGDGGGGDEDDEDEKEFGPLMNFEEVMKVAEKHGVALPSDMLEAAKATGLRKLILMRYLELEGSGWALNFLMKHCAILRNRMLADRSFLFKIGTEIVIDSCCATFAEVQKRGKEFWAEFELYAADLLVGIVVDIGLVTMLAPYARIGKRSIARGGLFSGLKNSVAALPSSVFEFERPGCRFSAQQRLATYIYKGILYGSVGFGCGLIGQGITNTIMNAKRPRRYS